MLGWTHRHSRVYWLLNVILLQKFSLPRHDSNIWLKKIPWFFIISSRKQIRTAQWLKHLMFIVFYKMHHSMRLILNAKSARGVEGVGIISGKDRHQIILLQVKYKHFQGTSWSFLSVLSGRQCNYGSWNILFHHNSYFYYDK